jgi:long-subunit fatty acid transport protein
LLCVPGARAQEERAIGNFAGVGVRAMGMGGAFAGVADDFTAIYWNPAGLAQMTNREVRVSFLRNGRETESTFNGTPGFSDLSNTRFGSMGFVYPYPVYQGSLVLAAGFNRVQDFDWNLNQKGVERLSDGALHANHLFQHEGEQSLAAVAAAVDVSPAISLGVTLGLISGKDVTTNEITWVDSGGFYQEHRYLATESFTDDYDRSLRATIGAMVRSSRNDPRFRFGATLALGSEQKVNYVFSGPLDSGYNRIDYDGDVGIATYEERDGTLRGTYKLSLPFEFGVGASYVPLAGLLLAGSAHIAEWTQAEYTGGDDNQFRADTSFESQYRDVVRYHLGVEWQVPNIALDLRAGFYTDPVPFVGPRDPDPLSTDPPFDIQLDRRFITIGAGLLLDGVVQLDAAWVRGKYEQLEQFRNPDDDELNDSFQSQTINRLIVGLGYSF